MRASRQSLLLSLTLPLLLGACATPGQSPTTLLPFTTDGCSLFPDRSADGSKDWRECCVTHDHRYWRGGPSALRVKADEELRACVAQTTGDKGLARVMYTGVRIGGSAYWPTSFRWAYGWGYGRFYTPLTEDEQREADRLEGEYRATDPNVRNKDAAVVPATASTDPHDARQASNELGARSLPIREQQSPKID